MRSRRCTWGAPDVSGISLSRTRGWPWSPMQHRTPRPPSPSPRTLTRAWTLSQTRRRSSSRKLSEGWRAQVPRALTRFPPVPQGRMAGGEGAGAEGPETPSQAPLRVHSRVAARTGAEGPEMRQRDPTACGEGRPPQRPARPLVLAADAIRPLGMASILLPSAAEGSCPVELGNPPILALTLLRHKGCTVLRIGFFLLHQCGALKSLG